MSTTPNYDIDYDRKEFQDVTNEKNAAIANFDNTYQDIIDKSDSFSQQQIQASKDYAETQKKNQQEQTDFAIEQIEQQKGYAEQDYQKEQSAAYKDWQKQSNAYGVNAEQRAAQGMANTGYSESSQVAMYTAYQNRVATAREAYVRAVVSYDNAIKDARLQNNSALAEIAYQSLKDQLELSLQGFQYKNQLVMEKANKRIELDQMYHQRWQDVLDQINKENSLAESVRQHNETLAENKRQHEASLAFQREQFNWQKAQAAKSSSGSGGNGRITKKSSKGSSNKTSVNNKTSNTSVNKSSKSSSDTATDYLNKLIASGASKDKVSNEIAIALREGAISKQEAAKLRQTFTPRGLQY